jgi:hypothetical protein
MPSMGLLMTLLALRTAHKMRLTLTAEPKLGF